MGNCCAFIKKSSDICNKADIETDINSDYKKRNSNHRKYNSPKQKDRVRGSMGGNDNVKMNVNNEDGDELKLIYELHTIDMKKCNMFGFGGKSFIAIVSDVYDGDTCKVIFKFNGEMSKHTIRMYGYDSPELKPKSNKKYPDGWGFNNRNEEHEFGLKARDILREKILGKIVKIDIVNGKKRNDPFGRLLGVIRLYDDHLNNYESINDWMVQSGYGHEYYGGKKT